MRKKTKILLAVDDCHDSRKAVEYVSWFMSASKDILCTLFTLEFWIPRILIEAGKDDPEAGPQIEQLIEKERREARDVVEHFKNVMIQNGIEEDRIETVSQPIQKGMAKDILMRSEDGGFSALVIGQKGLTSSKDFFIGTTAAKIVEHALSIPVWIVHEGVCASEFLIPVDGSEASLRAVEYAAGLLAPDTGASVTLFHVVPHLRHYFSLPFEREYPYLEGVLQREDKHRMERFLAQVNPLFHGKKKPSVNMKVNANSYDISTAILDEARTGRYGTVIVGRRGERKAYFEGRIPMRLIQKISGPTLWIVP